MDDLPTWRDLCIHHFPEVERFEGVEEFSNGSWYTSLDIGKIYHHLYNELRGGISEETCVKEAMFASSTDNPDESVAETLTPGTRAVDDDGFSYWCSTGKDDPAAPESLIYRLSTSLCVVHEVQIRPFEAIFQRGKPVYSAQEVRFRLGHECRQSSNGASGQSEYFWTYVSPNFPMKQEGTLQSFKLPRPVFCIGGVLQIELLGRHQSQEMDNKFYICICYVSVVGRPLQEYDIDKTKLFGQPRYILRYRNGNTL